MPQHSLALAPRAPDLPKPLGFSSIGQDGFPSRDDRRVGSPYFLIFKKFNAMKKVLLFLFFALLCGATATQAQTTRYVAPTATGSGDGSSWADASGDLHAMINASASGDAVWVKAGTYLPTQDPFGATAPADLRDKTFFIKDGVKLYGGFAGTETALSQRLITTNVTTLSGDIGTAGSATDNAYHVVLASTGSGGVGVTVDGFTITGGKADRTEPTTDSYLNVNGNNINRAYGGGIFTYNGTNILSNNTLSGNSVLGGGGGIYTYSGTNTLTNNTLSGNSAGTGGGIRTKDGTNTLSNNTLSGNSANQGGGILTERGTNTLSNNTLSGNSAGTGGGILTSSYGTNTLTNNTLSGNSAINYGGGIYTENGTNILSNNTLSGNSANQGGGIYAFNAENTIINNTFSDNSATSGGGGIYIRKMGGTTTSNLSNNLFWGNQQGGSSTVAGADYYNFFTTDTFTNNLMQLAASDYTAGNSNALGTQSDNIFATDPLFVNAADYRRRGQYPPHRRRWLALASR